MFGYPTGLGALIIRTENVDILDKVFFGGGSVSIASSETDFHELQCKPSSKLEDGTIPFLDIIALKKIGCCRSCAGAVFVLARLEADTTAAK
eukprot:1189212-Prorocentrum_minimum.AAC.1